MKKTSKKISAKTSAKTAPLSPFKQKVFDIVRKIPKGKVLTYRQVASLAGSPGASRAVGSVLSTNYDPRIPCHRVIRSDGGMGGYNRGIGNKLRILKKEKALV